MSREVNPRKAAVIGCGFVGSATAFTLMQSRLFSELVLLDVNMEKADGEAKDIAHGIPFAGQMKIYAGTYDDAADAAIIIITAGANQKPGETRLDLVQKNLSEYHPGDCKTRFWRDSADRIESGGYFDVCGIETEWAAGETGAWFGDGA